jgi:sRNA-binding carbon storage regulator CsrA
MFVLSRRKDEQIRLKMFDREKNTHTTVTITVTKIGRQRIKLRFDAPNDVLIERPEYLSKIGTMGYGTERPVP